MDLMSASIRTGDDVLVTAVLTAPIPRNDTVTVGVLTQSRDMHPVRLLIGKWVDRRPAKHYVEEYRGIHVERLNLPLSGLHVDGKTVTLTFPAATLDGLGNHGTWGAFTGAVSKYKDATGSDVDACPGPPGGMKTQPF